MKIFLILKNMPFWNNVTNFLTVIKMRIISTPFTLKEQFKKKNTVNVLLDFGVTKNQSFVYTANSQK